MIDIHAHALEYMPACVSTRATVRLEPKGELVGVSFPPPSRYGEPAQVLGLAASAFVLSAISLAPVPWR